MDGRVPSTSRRQLTNWFAGRADIFFIWHQPNPEAHPKEPDPIAHTLGAGVLDKWMLLFFGSPFFLPLGAGSDQSRSNFEERAESTSRRFYHRSRAMQSTRRSLAVWWTQKQDINKSVGTSTVHIGNVMSKLDLLSGSDASAQ